MNCLAPGPLLTVVLALFAGSAWGDSPSALEQLGGEPLRVAASRLQKTAGSQLPKDPTFKLLQFPGSDDVVKWGSPALGTPATIAYAFADRPMDLHLQVGDCQSVESLDTLILKSGLDRDAFLREVKAGIGLWSRVSGARFVFIADPGRADVVIGAVATGDGLTQSRAGLSKGARQKDGVAVLQKGAVCLDADQKWSLASSHALVADEKILSVRMVVAHEAGHLIGLDHPDDHDQVMDYHIVEGKSELRAGDIKGARLLYGAAGATP